MTGQETGIVRGFAFSTIGRVNASTPSFNSAPILF